MAFPLLLPVTGLTRQTPAPPAGSLAAAWESLYWSVAARGPLIAVGVEGLVELPNQPALPPGPQNAGELLSRYDAQLVRCGGVTAVAPRTMRLYDPLRSVAELGASLRDINPEPYFLLLLASLPSGQWQQLISEQGLALSVLDARQKRWLESALPENATFRLPQQAEPERRGLRLRLGRELAIQVTGLGGTGDGYAPTGQPDDNRAFGRTLSLRPDSAPPDDELLFLGRRVVPSKAKPSALDTSSPTLNTPVPLEGVNTVKALLARVSKATRQELIAETSLGERSVRTKGKSARAGDILQALCRGVSGTFRQVGPLFLLVEELPSAAERRERANADYQRFQVPQEQEIQQLSQLAAAARRRLSREGTVQKIPRSRQDAPGTLWALAERYDTETRLPLAQLTPGLRDEVTRLYTQQKTTVERFGGIVPTLPSEATAQQNLVLDLIAPEVQGVARVLELPAERLRQDEPTPEVPGPLVIPETLKTRAWQVALPRDEPEQTALLTLARRLKLTQLRVPITAAPDDEKWLLTLAKAAKEAGIGVVPVLSPLAALDANAPRERNAAGLTLVEWASKNAQDESAASRLARALARWEPVTPEALDTARFVLWATKLGAVPGVVGLGLESAAAPGYPEAEVGDWPLWIGGLTAERRAAFIRAHQTDPADLISASPFNIERETPQRVEQREVWDTAQRQRRDRALTRLHAALLAAKLPVPVSIRAGLPGKSGHWQRWRGVLPPDSVELDVTTGERPPLVPDDARPGLLHVPLLAFDSRLSGLGSELTALYDPTAQLRDWLDIELQPAIRPTPDHPDHWDGFVIDVSDRPLTAALTLLERALTDLPGASSGKAN